jgi:hypothetical protein
VLHDSFVVFPTQPKAQDHLDMLLARQKVIVAAIAQISKATEPHWQDQR